MSAPKDGHYYPGAGKPMLAAPTVTPQQRMRAAVRLQAWDCADLLPALGLDSDALQATALIAQARGGGAA